MHLCSCGFSLCSLFGRRTTSVQQVRTPTPPPMLPSTPIGPLLQPQNQFDNNGLETPRPTGTPSPSPPHSSLPLHLSSERFGAFIKD
jgi:hypothetical protein